MGYFRVLDEGLIGGVKQDQGLVGPGVVHPLLQLGPAGPGAGGVIGEAEVDQVHRAGGQRCREVVGGADRQVGKTAVLACPIGVAGVARHHVAVYINRINRIGYGNAVVGAEDVEDVAAVALGAIGDEDLLGTDVTAAGLEIVLSNRLPQPQVTLLRAVAMEALAVAQLVYGRLHGIAAGFWQWFGHIADAQANQRRIGVGFTEKLHPPGDFREEITSLELEVIAVDLNHGCRAAIAGAHPPMA